MTEIVIFFSMLSGSNYMVWNRYGHRQIPPPYTYTNTHTCMFTYSHTVADHTVVGHLVLWSTKLIRKQYGLFPHHTLGVFIGSYTMSPPH